MADEFAELEAYLRRAPAIGSAMEGGCKGPPAADGVVEIAYGVTPDYQGKGGRST